MHRIAASLASCAAILTGCFVLVLVGAEPACGQSLSGSQRSMDVQNDQARLHGFTYLETRTQMERLVGLGLLVPVEGNKDFFLKEVSFPVARPAVRTFIGELAKRYRAECGEQLVVTSLTRPRRYQPSNASWRSVHPTGMALDLRRSWNRKCRGWVESVLLHLEREGVLDATRERHPSHYHIALFPEPFERFLASGADWGSWKMYQVVRGDTLASIARRHNTTVSIVKDINGIRSSRIYAGQVLRLR